MGRLFLVNLDGKSYSCKHCNTSLALSDDIISKMEDTEKHVGLVVVVVKEFRSRHGKAYLFSEVVNVYVGKKEDRMMMTGMHTVVDIYCVKCGSCVGWRYEFAFEKNQKYKEGKYVLEKYKLILDSWVDPEVEAGDSDSDDT